MSPMSSVIGWGSPCVIKDIWIEVRVLTMSRTKNQTCINIRPMWFMGWELKSSRENSEMCVTRKRTKNSKICNKINSIRRAEISSSRDNWLEDPLLIFHSQPLIKTTGLKTRYSYSTLSLWSKQLAWRPATHIPLSASDQDNWLEDQLLIPHSASS